MKIKSKKDCDRVYGYIRNVKHLKAKLSKKTKITLSYKHGSRVIDNSLTVTTESLGTVFEQNIPFNAIQEYLWSIKSYINKELEKKEYIGIKDVEGEKLYLDDIVRDTIGRWFRIVWKQDFKQYRLRKYNAEELHDFRIVNMESLKIRKIGNCKVTPGLLEVETYTTESLMDVRRTIKKDNKEAV